MMIHFTNKKSIKKTFFTKSFAFTVVVAIIVSLFSTTCKDQNANNFSSDIVFPDSNISFAKYVEPLFLQTCVAVGCHGGNSPQGNLSLELNQYNNLLNHDPDRIIVQGNGNSSILVQRLDGRLQPQMPIGHPLTKNQINGVKKWIDEGAKNN